MLTEGKMKGNMKEFKSSSKSVHQPKAPTLNPGFSYPNYGELLLDEIIEIKSLLQKILREVDRPQ